jgi:hypothetical protein
MAISHSPRIVRDGLVLALDAADRNSYPGTGTTWNDLSGNGNNGTLQGGPTFNSNNGGYFSLDGTDDYFSTSFNPNLNNNRLYTYEVWFRDDVADGPNFSTNTALISNYGPSGTTPLSILHISETGKAYIAERNSSGISTGDVSTNSSIVTGEWVHIIGVATSTTLFIYVNGVQQTSTASRPGGTITSGQNFVLGGNHLNRYQTCDIPIFKVYLDKAFTASEVLQNYNATKTRFGL